MNTKELFLKATQDWYLFVNRDHHKDRDCHWEIGIQKTYSYGKDSTTPRWYVRHEGYITDFWEEGDSEEDVMHKATEFIKREIESNT